MKCYLRKAMKTKNMEDIQGIRFYWLPTSKYRILVAEYLHSVYNKEMKITTLNQILTKILVIGEERIYTKIEPKEKSL